MQNGKKKKAMHMMRALRLQLKTGYMKEQPAEYIFMKRYPPLSRDTQPRFHKPKEVNIPYMGLYDKAVERNPLYVDELVYPAYWNQEPQALTLAKKQYEYMQQGFDEESAYKKAIAYVDVIEDDAYTEMNKVSQTLQSMGAKAPFLTDSSIVQEMAVLKGKMEGIAHTDMDLADQGEMDHLIQTKILKWTEVERERRMKDPIFVQHFDELRRALFPLADSVVAKMKSQMKADERNEFYALMELDPSKLITMSPFFLEDYIYHFVRIKAQPDLRRWRAEDRSDLSRWVCDCLALKEVMEKGENFATQKYLNDLRVQFFPMIQYPDRADQFQEPSVEGVKALLYSKGIGYKTTEEGLYIRRFYKLPMLLFPEETAASAIESENAEAVEAQMSTQNSVLDDVLGGAKVSEKTSKQLAEQLAPLLEGTGLDLPDYEHKGPPMNEADIVASLDTILNDADREIKQRRNMPAGTSTVSENGADAVTEAENQLKEIRRLLKKLGLSKESENEDVSSVLAALREQYKGKEPVWLGNDPNHPREEAPARFVMGEEKWQEVVEHHVPAPKTTLEKLRDEYFRVNEMYDIKDADCELDLTAFKQSRERDAMIVRTRLMRDYELKEGARRKRDAKRRGVMEYGRPDMQLSISRKGELL